ncbi:hypothetical protein PTI98_005906 [Pleurotus ostreatus]|nr:hypothetical protein PTI98_005906 [Pleurotus ostreatus]
MITTPFIALVLALSAVATPLVTIRSTPVTLPLAKRLNITKGVDLGKQARARAKGLRALGEAKARGASHFEIGAIINEPVVNQAVTYTAVARIGNPATTFPNLLIDTGSSNTWVGATTPFRNTATTQDTGELMQVTYGSGFVLGEEVLDKFDLGGGLVVPQQSIGSAIFQSGFDGLDGILGIGPVGLTSGTTQGGGLVPTVTDNLFSSGIISANQIGISFNPTTTVVSPNGELTWGGVDTSKFTGGLTFVPVTSTSPASSFWGIDQSVSIGNNVILPTTAGIVDTGTTLLLIATDAFARYQASTGGVPDAATGLLRITPQQFINLQNVDFHIGGTTFTLVPNAQIWPRALNTAIGGSNSFVYLIVADLGTPSGEGFDFVNGFAFLERFYSVFDTTNRRVGFATTPNTAAPIN